MFAGKQAQGPSSTANGTTNGAANGAAHSPNALPSSTLMVQHLAGNFVISSGSTLFRRAPRTAELELCILHQPRKHKYILPKGRKDYGESLEAACLRETYEETGYPCELVPLRMPTRATQPGDLAGRDVSVVRDAMVEPVGVTVMDREDKGGKLIMWYVTRLKDGAAKVDGTQMASENYESQFIEARRAISLLTLPQHRDLARQALELILSTEASLGRKVI
ncbi:NUDIX hydrolase domain-like protein [Phanerochaete sordida]|uniref:NUDIX hydrolase domain-like protein n=1 Tax=Phanerochaete sordida TaxID=48140 RepID=A0A9P3GBE3_9APHY|nr:NUDIX hydrolase domain-like protein [Phanerochaete sordida]